MENFMANQKKCEKCGKTYMPNHQSAECPHERLVDMKPDGVKRIRPGRLEPKPDDSKWMWLKTLREGALFETKDGILAVKSEYVYSNQPDSQCQCILLASGEYAHFDKGNRELVREIIAKTVSILQAEISQLKEESDARRELLMRMTEKCEALTAERLDRPSREKIAVLLCGNEGRDEPFPCKGCRKKAGQILALIPDDKVVAEAQLDELLEWQNKIVHAVHFDNEIKPNGNVMIKGGAIQDILKEMLIRKQALKSHYTEEK